MRALFVSFLAWCAGGLASGLIAQQLAVWSGAGEEFILVFMSVALIDVGAAIAFFIAQVMPNPASAVARIGKTLLALMIVAGLVLVVWSVAESGVSTGDWPILSGLVVPPIVVIAVQWLVVRFMRRRVSAALGKAVS